MSSQRWDIEYQEWCSSTLSGDVEPGADLLILLITLHTDTRLRNVLEISKYITRRNLSSLASENT